MGYAESKAKLGDRGSIKSGKTFNKESGTNKSKFHTSWEGKTKGDTTHKKQR